MQNKKNITQDYLDAITYSQLLANHKGSEFINSENLFFGVYKYLDNYEFGIFFWKLIGVTDITVFEKYFKKHYGKSFNFNIKVSIKNLKFDKDLKKEINGLGRKGIKKLDFVALLYIAIDNINDDLYDFFNDNGIDVELIRDKLWGLLFETKITTIGSMDLLDLLNKTFDLLNLDLNKSEMSIQIDKDMDKNDILDLVDGNGNSDQDIMDESHVSSKVKEEKKLAIEYFGNDLTKEAKEGYLDPVIGREKEIDQLIYTLLRKTKNNPLLIGEAGVGKTAIVEGFAQRIVKGEVPERLLNKKVYMLDMGTLVAGTKYRGEFEARFKSILDEATDPTNNIILFIDELHTIIGTGNAEGSADAANMLKPMLSRGKIQLIGATTFDEYQKYIEKDPALKRRFQEINVEEPIRDDAIQILTGLKQKFEDYHGVNISDESIASSVDYSIRYILNKHLPDKAIDLIDEACARKSTLNDKLKNNDDYKDLEVSLEKLQKSIEKAIQEQDYFTAAELKQQEDTIKQKIKNLRTQTALPKHLRSTIDSFDVGGVLADKLGLPLEKITSTEIDKLRDLDKILSGKILGQNQAVEDIVKAIRRNRLSMVQRNKPIASFLFLGPSGVGKTFLVKLLAKEFFGDDKSLIRVDMSEFTEKYSVGKLIGSAPGYVGYEEGGQLTEAVRRRPYSIVLFDEIEKASPEVLNILLQILDEGYLKDNKGRIIDFKNTLIVLTSNIGSSEFGKKVAKIGFDTIEEKDQLDHNFDLIKGRVMEKLKDYLLPELLNRFDKVIVFKPLDKVTLANIFKEKLADFFEHWKVREEVKLPKYNDKKVSEIIDQIYDPEFGARPIERYILEEIEPILIDQLLKVA